METEARITTRTERTDPRGLTLLDLNARYMRHEVFQRLVDNIRRDGGLTGNTPFAWRVHDDTTQQPLDPPQYLVLSGNHRVKAAIAAELEAIDVTVTDDYLPPDRRRAIQLSHNALAGEDDPAILKTIYESIGEVELRLYSGLDDKTLKLLAEVSVSALSEAGLEFQTIGITFLPHERELVEAAWTQARKQFAGSKGYWLARWEEYDRLLDALEAAGQAHGVKNTATALMLVLDVFWRHVTDLSDGWIETGGEVVDPKRDVPTVSVFGLTVPASLGAKLKKLGKDPAEALDKLLGGPDGAGKPSKRDKKAQAKANHAERPDKPDEPATLPTPDQSAQDQAGGAETPDKPAAPDEQTQDQVE